MTKSISLRSIKKFKIPNGNTTIEKADVPLGSIEKANNTFTISGHTLQIYNCKFSKDVNEEISVLVDEDYMELNNYKKKFDFKMYYCPALQLIFSDSTTPITKSFFKALDATPEIQLEYSVPHFDLDHICNQFIQTKGMGFSSDDEGINSKALYGSDVTSNDEATAALENDISNRVMGSLKIAGVPYTIMFSQSGSIVAFSKLPNNIEAKEYPMLSFAFEILQEINFLND